MTAQRQLILEIIRSSKRHLSAEDIFFEAREELPELRASLETINKAAGELRSEEHTSELQSP